MFSPAPGVPRTRLDGSTQADRWIGYGRRAAACAGSLQRSPVLFLQSATPAGEDPLLGSHGVLPVAEAAL